MIRSELKKTAQRYLHGNYGNWSWIVLLPAIALFCYFFFVIFLSSLSASVMQQPDSLSLYDDYSGSANQAIIDYQQGYEDGYIEGYNEGYDDGLFEDDTYDDEFEYEEKNLHSPVTTTNMMPLQNSSRSVNYRHTSSATGIIASFFLFILGVAAMAVAILYRGIIQWAAIDNVEERSFSLKTVLIDFIKVNGKRTVVANLLVTLYTFLWSLLFVIPGVIKQLSYSMTNYLLKKDPNLTAKEAIALSQELMRGYKLEYLIFSYSFILWQFAMTFSFGLAGVYVIPYAGVSEALFFDQIIADKHHLFSEEKEAGFADF
ncbi:DUF975 family protein [Enterococcus sp. 5H]|uniref:DUF975 family protein n=1 Tax=Enterococcus sp. 5H TaxID=1229490 RepID=UPI0023033839|nr:DUF975 family protein [Enterococcus sp. 5H]MDA9471552.1 putative integral membrane protein [Enterococcus sp. 5H]